MSKKIKVTIEVDNSVYEATFVATSECNVYPAYNILIDRIWTGYGGKPEILDDLGNKLAIFKCDKLYVPVWAYVRHYTRMALIEPIKKTIRGLKHLIRLIRRLTR